MLELWRFVLPSNSTKSGTNSTPDAIAYAPEKALRPREAVLRMAEYHPPTGGRRNKLRLDFNENTVGAPPHVLDFIKRYLTAADLSIYPEYDHALEDLCLHFSVNIDELTLTNGTDEAIQALVNTYIDDNDEVLLLRPSYAMYKFYSQLAGAKLEEIDYTPGTLAFPFSELMDKITPETRAVFISNPNNPTGTGTDLASIEKILEKASNAAVLIDEAYYEFSGITALPLINRYSNLFVSRTFSKTYGMAAMRCGCLFSNSSNIAYVRKAQSPYSVNALAAMAARIAIQDEKFVQDYVLEVLTARELLYVGLERLKIPYIRSQANFVLFDAGDRAIAIRDELRRRGVLVRDRSYEIPGCVRVTVGTRDQVQRFLDELEQIWQ
jgi:histidinol-phosphate aminotransferase